MINHSCVQGWDGTFGGEGNIGSNPRFADDDLRLMGNSPAINAGDSDVLPPGVEFDLDGNPRIINGVVDMGAYEFQDEPCNLADLNCDGIVDGADLLILLSAWGTCADPDACPADLNEDGVVDGADLLILLSNWG